MTYIVEPNWIYFINIVDKLRTFIGVIMIVLGVASVALFVFYMTGLSERASYGEDDSDWKFAKSLKKPMIICVVLAIIFGIILVFIPSKDTLIEMKIANYATIENAELTLEAFKNAVDYIVEAIKEIK